MWYCVTRWDGAYWWQKRHWTLTPDEARPYSSTARFRSKCRAYACYDKIPMGYRDMWWRPARQKHERYLIETFGKRV